MPPKRLRASRDYPATGYVTMQALTFAKAKADLERMLGAPLERLDPDAVSKRCSEIRWKPIMDWGSASDQVVARQTNLDQDLRREAGTIVMVTDAAFQVGGTALSFSPPEFSAVSAYHLTETNELIFGGGDVVIWCANSSSIWLFHHEGIFARWSRESSHP